jgi:C-5 cytosine-specific DNA methylase
MATHENPSQGWIKHHMTKGTNGESTEGPLQPAGRKWTYVDLFSGCGGFSLGLEWAGLKCLAAIDFNDAAIETFKANPP